MYSVTVDNASSNNISVDYLKNKLLSWGASSIRLKFLHMRCIARILNLIINGGLKEVNVSVKKLREAIKYMKNSHIRLRKFREISYLLGIDSKSSLSLDMPFKWN